MHTFRTFVLAFLFALPDTRARAEAPPIPRLRSPESSLALCAHRNAILRMLHLRPADRMFYETLLSAADERLATHIDAVLPGASKSVTIGQYCAQTALDLDDAPEAPPEEHAARRRITAGSALLGIGILGLTGTNLSLGLCEEQNYNCGPDAFYAMIAGWTVASAMILGGATLLGIGVRNQHLFSAPRLSHIAMARRQLSAGGAMLGLGLVSALGGTAVALVCDYCIVTAIPLWAIGGVLLVPGSRAIHLGRRNAREARRLSFSIRPGPRLIGATLDVSF